MGVGMGVVVHWGAAAASSPSIQMENEGLQSDLLLLSDLNLKSTQVTKIHK